MEVWESQRLYYFFTKNVTGLSDNEAIKINNSIGIANSADIFFGLLHPNIRLLNQIFELVLSFQQRSCIFLSLCFGIKRLDLGEVPTANN
jgi:hypothetical protein